MCFRVRDDGLGGMARSIGTRLTAVIGNRDFGAGARSPAAPTKALKPRGTRGRSVPLPDRNVQRCVGWLERVTVLQASPGGAAETPLRAPPGTTDFRSSRASSPASWSSASKTATGGQSLLGDGRSLPRTAFSPYP